MIVRIDDVSVNTDLAKLRRTVDLLRARLPGVEIWMACSVLTKDMSRTAKPDRIFPDIWKPQSDHRVYYQLDRCGIPQLSSFGDVHLCSHGLVHCDHRLLSRGEQELSILVSCSLLNAWRFVPPFNYYNRDTASVCDEHNIKLVRWEDGWKHVLHNAFDPEHDRYYLHPHDVTAEYLEKWLP